jgi:hypothetical protein
MLRRPTRRTTRLLFPLQGVLVTDRTQVFHGVTVTREACRCVGATNREAQHQACGNSATAKYEGTERSTLSAGLPGLGGKVCSIGAVTNSRDRDATIRWISAAPHEHKRYARTAPTRWVALRARRAALTQSLTPDCQREVWRNDSGKCSHSKYVMPCSTMSEIETAFVLLTSCR